jgi:hypothetical protein
MNIRNALTGLIVSAISVGILVACGGGGGSSDEPAPPPPAAPTTTFIRSATLTGAQEVPPVTTTATARGAIIVNPTTKEITGGLTYTGPTPTRVEINQAASGATGAAIITLTTMANSATAATSVVPAGTVLTDAQFNALIAGQLYFNVVTPGHPGGEIRGQITTQGGVVGGLSTLNGTKEVPPVPTNATGRGTVVVDSTTRQILIAYVTHTVANANQAHIHVGATGVNGGIRVGLDLLSTTIAAATQGAVFATAQDMTDLSAGALYFNVHSPGLYSDGEIRGQIDVVQ